MAKYTPGIQAAKEIADTLNQEEVIIIMVNSRTGKIRSASYGKTKALCEHGKKVLDVAGIAVIKAYESGAL